MRYLRIGFKFKALDEISFPPNPVNTFRGALGYSLKNLTCIQRSNKMLRCHECLVPENCGYAICFETNLSHAKLQTFGNNTDIPHLMIIDAGFPGQHTLKKNEEFTFFVTIMGKAVDTFPYLLIAAQNAANNGLTMKKVPCELISASNQPDNIIFWTRDTYELAIPNAKEINLDEPDFNLNSIKQIELKFITPVAFKDKKTGNVSLKPDFHRIIGSLMRRYSSFCLSEGKPISWRFKEISKIAEKVKIQSTDLTPIRWERYSTRQKQRIPVAGIIGTANYIGPIEPFIELIKTAQIIKAGRSTTYGQGKIVLTKILD